MASRGKREDPAERERSRRQRNDEFILERKVDDGREHNESISVVMS